MIAFEVTINGNRVCTAGIDPCGVITAVLSLVRRKEISSGKNPDGELAFSVSGLLSDLGEGSERLKWIEDNLQPGDTVTIRIVEAAQTDEAKERRRESPKTEAQRHRAYRERLKRQYGLRETRRSRSSQSRQGRKK